MYAFTVRLRYPLYVLAFGFEQVVSAQAVMFDKMSSWRAQWQYWSALVQLTEAMAAGSQLFFATISRILRFVQVDSQCNEGALSPVDRLAQARLWRDLLRRGAA